MQNSKCTMHDICLILCILHGAFWISSCSIPNLEPPACSEARDAVKKFYSFHFGNEMHPSIENLKMREPFLTAEFIKSLSADGETSNDIFTASETPPKTFKIGECKVTGENKSDLQIQLYWRDEAKTTQKEVHVEAVKTGDAWLINKISN